MDSDSIIPQVRVLLSQPPRSKHCIACSDFFAKIRAHSRNCSSRQVTAIIAWIRQQPFYENATVIICGEHQTMDPQFLADIDESYPRTIYNCIINAPIEPVKYDTKFLGMTSTSE